jgi:hypothetical protein
MACLEVFCRAVALRCGEERYAPKNLRKKVGERVLSLERKGDMFASELLKSIRRHYFPFFIHLSQERYLPIRDWITHYGVATLGPYTTKVKNGIGTSAGPNVFESPMTASTFSKLLLHSTEWLTKDSFRIMLGVPPPTEDQFLVKRSDLSRLGVYSLEASWDPE